MSIGRTLCWCQIALEPNRRKMFDGILDFHGDSSSHCSGYIDVCSLCGAYSFYFILFSSPYPLRWFSFKSLNVNTSLNYGPIKLIAAILKIPYEVEFNIGLIGLYKQHNQPYTVTLKYPPLILTVIQHVIMTNMFQKLDEIPRDVGKK